MEVIISVREDTSTSVSLNVRKCRLQFIVSGDAYWRRKKCLCIMKTVFWFDTRWWMHIQKLRSGFVLIWLSAVCVSILTKMHRPVVITILWRMVSKLACIRDIRSFICSWVRKMNSVSILTGTGELNIQRNVNVDMISMRICTFRVILK